MSRSSWRIVRDLLGHLLVESARGRLRPRAGEGDAPRLQHPLDGAVLALAAVQGEKIDAAGRAFQRLDQRGEPRRPERHEVAFEGALALAQVGPLHLEDGAVGGEEPGCRLVEHGGDVLRRGHRDAPLVGGAAEENGHPGTGHRRRT